MEHQTRQRLGFDPMSLDDDTVDRLLDGEISKEEAPEGYGDVAQLLSTVVNHDTKLNGEAASVAALAAAIRSPKPVRRRKRMLGSITGAKIAALAMGAVLSTGGAAAAATGQLPAPAQDLVASNVSQHGINVPISDRMADEFASNHPDAALCLEAQQQADAKGCSKRAKAYARWLAKKEAREERKAAREGRLAEFKAAHEKLVEERKAKRDERIAKHEANRDARIQEHEAKRDERIAEHDVNRDARIQEHEANRDARIQEHEANRDKRMAEHAAKKQ